MSESIQPRVVTLSTLYGTEDQTIGRHVAERLGVVFVDREIPAFVAEQLHLPDTAVAVYDEHQRSTLERLIDSRTLPCRLRSRRSSDWRLASANTR